MYIPDFAINAAGLIAAATSDIATIAGAVGTVEEIVGAVAFLVGKESGWVHGQVLRVNGGLV